MKERRREVGVLHYRSCPTGDSSYDITNVDPMVIKEIDVKNGPKQAGLHLTLRDVKLHGLRTTVLLKSE